MLERITPNPRIVIGKPAIRGTRLTVEYILNFLAHGMTEEEILDEYGGLAHEDLRRCLLFAAQSLQSTLFVPLALETAWMRFPADECTGPAVAQRLGDQHDGVFSVFEEARSLDDDGVVLEAIPFK